MDLTYAPVATTGFTVRLCRSSEDVLTITASAMRSPEPQVDLTGERDFRANPALVRLIESFGEHEYWSRRLRAAEKRKSHQEAAAEARRAAVALAALIDRRTDDSDFAWCSGCLYKTQHHRVDGPKVQTSYICVSCGTATTRCSVPRCGHMALRGHGRSMARYCAPHRHEIPSFEKLDDRLPSLTDYDKWLEFESRNAVAATKLAATSVAAMAAVMPLGLAAAPAVGGAIGATTGLSGAAATSHGLALLGGGALSAGGLGMAGGTAVVTAAGTALGGALGASIASAYVSSDDSFRIEQLRSGTGANVIFATGFLSEAKTGWGEWRELIDRAYPDSTVYRLHWGASELKALGLSAATVGAKTAMKSSLRTIAATASKKAASRLGPLGGALLAADFLKNPWSVARTRASMTGAALAEIISRTNEGPFTLLGHSLGGRVMVHAGLALGTRPGAPRIADMHLLGAAVGTDNDWRPLSAAVSGHVTNYWSRNDDVLHLGYRTAERGEHAIGRVGMQSKFPNIRDRNVSRQVGSHVRYVTMVRLEV